MNIFVSSYCHSTAKAFANLWAKHLGMECVELELDRGRVPGCNVSITDFGGVLELDNCVFFSDNIASWDLKDLAGPKETAKHFIINVIRPFDEALVLNILAHRNGLHIRDVEFAKIVSDTEKLMPELSAYSFVNLLIEAKVRSIVEEVIRFRLFESKLYAPNALTLSFGNILDDPRKAFLRVANLIDYAPTPIGARKFIDALNDSLILDEALHDKSSYLDSRNVTHLAHLQKTLRRSSLKNVV